MDNLDLEFLKKQLARITPTMGIGLAIIAISLGSSIFFYSKYRKTTKEQQPFTEIEQVVREVSKLMEVPTGETPTLATVSDKTKLQNQEFFQKAENGDRILVYPQAKKAILYRPSTKKIVDIAPVMALADVTGQITPVLAEKDSLVKIALYNGTQTPGLTDLAEKKLNEDAEIGSKIEIVAKERAKGAYSQTMVVDLSGERAEITEKISKALNGLVKSALPEGEVASEAQIVILLGNQ